MYADYPSETFQILYVCVGNICRSPMAERLTRFEIGARLGPYAQWFHVSSAGTRGLVGQEMHRYAADVLRGSGVDPGGFAARRLSREILHSADLVLVATAVERDQVVALYPRALRRTFTIREFARLASAVNPEPDFVDWPASEDPGYELADRARTVVAHALAMRGRLPYVDPDVDDIDDPVNGAPEAFYECGMAIATAVGTAVAALLGVDIAATTDADPYEQGPVDQFVDPWPAAADY
jgi:protein-tyrosine phosphatase